MIRRKRDRFFMSSNIERMNGPAKQADIGKALPDFRPAHPELPTRYIGEFVEGLNPGIMATAQQRCRRIRTRILAKGVD